MIITFKIKFIALFLGLQFTVAAQDHCAVLFDEIQLKTEFPALSNEELIDLCAAHSDDFNQAVFTYGSEDQNDWLNVGQSVQLFSVDMKPEGRWIDLNGDKKRDLVISFLAGYEYTFVAFYLRNSNGFECIHTGNGEFFGKTPDKSFVYVDPACCDDPSHEFFVLEGEEDAWTVTDSFSVTNAYSSTFPTRQELDAGSEGYPSKVDITAIGRSGEEILVFPAGSTFRIFNEIEGDGRLLHFVEAHWEGDTDLFPKVYCWVELPE